ncbi:signal peptidase I [Paenarthrobacter sp. Z7-10]|uniref:signal peptidase I n=1 Tax=Paenarthrobacter sp. Z7-10 TaxID=2787635 RepID=UPI0022A915D3|nr:signal peptidase I [Paenarthrobacter sp. Z7-10]MCZ2404830.1 signal peptidase I [Paenarthrobacter sp. Z7-10]
MSSFTIYGTRDGAAAAVPRRAASGRRRAVSTPSGLKELVGPAMPVIGTILLIIAAALFLLLAIGPRVMGYQTTTMLTGSMSPGINPGDVVVAAPAAVGDLKVGDIITYQIPVEDHRVETHRIIEVIANLDGSTAVRTKGDSNNGSDPWTATLQGQTVFRHVGTIPYLGTVIRTLREPALRTALMYGAPSVLVIGLLLSIWKKSPEDPTGGRSTAHADA